MRMTKGHGGVVVILDKQSRVLIQIPTYAQPIFRPLFQIYFILKIRDILNTSKVSFKTYTYT